MEPHELWGVEIRQICDRQEEGSVCFQGKYSQGGSESAIGYAHKGNRYIQK